MIWKPSIEYFIFSNALPCSVPIASRSFILWALLPTFLLRLLYQCSSVQGNGNLLGRIWYWQPHRSCCADIIPHFCSTLRFAHTLSCNESPTIKFHTILTNGSTAKINSALWTDCICEGVSWALYSGTLPNTFQALRSFIVFGVDVEDGIPLRRDICQFAAF